MKTFPYLEYGMVWVISFTMAFGIGCGGADPNLPPLVPASGRVTLDGKPLAGAFVSFVPTGSTRGTGAEACTDQDGRYELVSRHGRGAVVGSYRVTISKWLMPDGSDYVPQPGVGPEESPARQVLPPRYSDLQQTTLSAAIPEGGSKTLDFALTP